MTRDNVREILIQLRDIIKAEREYAKQLDIKAMQNAMAQKETLIQALGPVHQLHPEDKPIAKEIQTENRRNAFLFRATLNWIQDTMQFFGRKSVPTTYGQQGNTINTAMNGRLLSGRI